MVQLKALISNPSRTWIGQSQPPVEYATGTRLFAYRALRNQLTCRQLRAALTEIAAADKTFRAPAPGVSAAQAKRVLTLNSEVEQELRAEQASRCKD
jgi:hypothetical protein